MSVLIIGAGMAGMSCATALQRSGHDVRLIDKGRGAGGRMATRRISIGDTQIGVDHGAQYLRPKSAAFAQQLADWEADGVMARWTLGDAARKGPAWVGTPGMNAPLKAMAADLPIAWGTRAERLERHDDRWTITAGEETLHAETVILAIPAEQTHDLLTASAIDPAAIVGGAKASPVWAAMLVFATPLPGGIQALTGDSLPQDSPVGWAARNSGKPGRPAQHDAWIVHAAQGWSEAHIEDSPESVASDLQNALETALALPPQSPIGAAAHRWRYALTEHIRQPAAPYWDATQALGVCGDWCLGDRVEHAWHSGVALATAMARGEDGQGMQQFSQQR